MSILQEQKIPPGWTEVNLGDIAEIVRGISFPKNEKHLIPGAELVACLRTSNVQTQVDWAGLWFIPKFFVKRPDQYIKPHDILISLSNSLELVGKVAQVTQLPYQATLGAFIALIRVDQAFDSRFFYFQLAAAETQARMRQVASTTTNISNISTGKLARLPILVPPRAEQSRIVSELEKNLTRLDAATNLLSKVRHNLERYRAVVLKEACKPRGLAAHVRQIQLADILRDDLSNGRSVPSQSSGFPVLRLTALTRGRLDLTQRKEGSWKREDALPFLVKKGDFFVARGNGSLSLVGRGALLEIEPDEVAFPDTMIRVRVDPEKYDPLFLRLIWDSTFVRNQIEERARTTAGIYKINQNDLRRVCLPAPPLDAQRIIVEQAERLLSLARQLERIVQDNHQRAQSLRNSILAKAFEGKLTPQDPKDEPASVLLERIGQERESAGENQPRRRGRRPTIDTEKPRSRRAAR